jgi:serine/threonine protein kinase
MSENPDKRARIIYRTRLGEADPIFGRPPEIFEETDDDYAMNRLRGELRDNQIQLDIVKRQNQILRDEIFRSRVSFKDEIDRLKVKHTREIKSYAREIHSLTSDTLKNQDEIYESKIELISMLETDIKDLESKKLGGGSFGIILPSKNPGLCFKIFKSPIIMFNHPPISYRILQPLALVSKQNISGIVYKRYKCSLDVIISSDKLPEIKRLLINQLNELIVELNKVHWVHGDIKPANILVDYDNKLVIGDSEEMCQTSLRTLTYTQTRRYSPAYFNVKPGERKEHDLWSFGIIMYEIECGSPIKHDAELKDIKKLLGERAILLDDVPENRSKYLELLR